MQPVFQQNYDIKTADCFAACVATLLHLPLDRVPNFCAVASPHFWWSDFQDWLKPFGLTAISVKLGENVRPLATPTLGTEVILTGKSCLGDWQHSVVGIMGFSGFECVHNPNPYTSGKFLDGPPERVLFLALLSPHEIMKGD